MCMLKVQETLTYPHGKEGFAEAESNNNNNNNNSHIYTNAP